MFTFGREHEAKCALLYVKGPENVRLISELVDAVHDFLVGKAGQEQLISAARSAFVSGGAGVWEQTSTWLDKLAQENDWVEPLWHELSAHPSATIRVRVAGCLRTMPPTIARAVSPRLLEDRAASVREMAAESLAMLAKRCGGVV